MRVRHHLYLFPLIAALFCLSLIATADVGPTYAIRNAKIVPVSGPAIDKGILIIRNGLIETVGAADIVLTDGDILETRTNIKKVYIDGKACDLSNKYTELLDKFKKRG